MAKGKPGLAYMAYMTEVPITPVALTGTETVWSSWKKFKRPTVSIRFGESYVLSGLDRKRRAEMLEEATEELMYKIAAMLPESYRGVYK